MKANIILLKITGDYDLKVLYNAEEFHKRDSIKNLSLDRYCTHIFTQQSREGSSRRI